MSEAEDSLDIFIGQAVAHIGLLPDIRLARINHSQVGHYCALEMLCGKTRGELIWVEEHRHRDQLPPQLNERIGWMRRHEAERVAEREILMGTVARFYVDEER